MARGRFALAVHALVRLARSAAGISLTDVYRAVAREPSVRPNPAANPRCPVSVAMSPALAKIAAVAEARFQEAPARRTLADVVELLDVTVPCTPSA